jgi:phage-related protein
MLAPLVIILQLIGEVIGMVLAPILGALTTFITPILNIIIQIITVLKPVIMLIGQLLGLFLRFNPIMNLMSIGIQVLFGAIAAVYNYVIMPIANVIIQIIGFIANAIANVANFIINILNHLPGVNIRKVSGIDTEAMKLQKIDLDATAEEHQNTSGYGTESIGISTSGSGSYSAAKDVIVNIYFNNSYVNGDARQIALSLKAELEAVGALGY